MNDTATLSARGLGFFTVLLILTLNADNGKDLLDVMVPYIEASTTLTLKDAEYDKTK